MKRLPDIDLHSPAVKALDAFDPFQYEDYADAAAALESQRTADTHNHGDKMAARIYLTLLGAAYAAFRAVGDETAHEAALGASITHPYLKAIGADVKDLPDYLKRGDFVLDDLPPNARRMAAAELRRRVIKRGGQGEGQARWFSKFNPTPEQVAVMLKWVT